MENPDYSQMLYRILPFLAALLVYWYAPAAAAQNASQSPVVVELFTSKNCPSCPAAERYMSELLQQNKNLIALSCHVTYWNRPGRSDPLSTPACTRRQQKYVAALGNNGKIYTPQMVVNGRDEFVGSYRDEAREALSKAMPVTPISISKQDGKTLMAQLPQMPPSTYTLVTFGYKNNMTNSITYAPPTESWNGGAKTKGITMPNDNDVDGLVILVQSAKTGAILGAGKIKL